MYISVPKYSGLYFFSGTEITLLDPCDKTFCSSQNTVYFFTIRHFDLIIEASKSSGHLTLCTIHGEVQHVSVCVAARLCAWLPFTTGDRWPE